MTLRGVECGANSDPSPLEDSELTKSPKRKEHNCCVWIRESNQHGGKGRSLRLDALNMRDICTQCITLGTSSD